MSESMNRTNVFPIQMSFLMLLFIVPMVYSYGGFSEGIMTGQNGEGGEITLTDIGYLSKVNGFEVEGDSGDGSFIDDNTISKDSYAYSETSRHDSFSFWVPNSFTIESSIYFTSNLSSRDYSGAGSLDIYLTGYPFKDSHKSGNNQLELELGFWDNDTWNSTILFESKTKGHGKNIKYSELELVEDVSIFSNVSLEEVKKNVFKLHCDFDELEPIQNTVNQHKFIITCRVNVKNYHNGDSTVSLRISEVDMYWNTGPSVEIIGDSFVETDCGESVLLNWTIFDDFTELGTYQIDPVFTVDNPSGFYESNIENNIQVETNQSLLPGEYSINLSAYDGTLTDTKTITLSVKNDLPLFSMISNPTNYTLGDSSLLSFLIEDQYFDSNSANFSLMLDNKMVYTNDWDHSGIYNISLENIFSLVEVGIHNYSFIIFDGFDSIQTNNFSLEILNIKPIIFGQTLIQVSAGADIDYYYEIFDFSVNSTGSLFEVYKDCDVNFENGILYQEGTWENYEIITFSTGDFSLIPGIQFFQIYISDGFGMTTTFNITLIILNDIPVIDISNYQPFLTEVSEGNLTIQVFDSTVTSPNSLEIRQNGTLIESISDWIDGELVNISYSLMNEIEGLHNITITAYDGISYTSTRQVLILTQIENGSIYGVNGKPVIIGQPIFSLPVSSQIELFYQIIDYSINSSISNYSIYRDCDIDFDNGILYEEGIWDNFEVITISTADFSSTPGTERLVIQVFDGLGMNATFNITLLITNDVPLIDVTNYQALIDDQTDGNLTIQVFDSTVTTPNSLEIRLNGTLIESISDWIDGELVNISYSLMNEIEGLHNITITAYDGISYTSTRQVLILTQSDYGSIYGVNAKPIILGQSTIEVPIESDSIINYKTIDYTTNSSERSYEIYKDCDENFKNGILFRQDTWVNLQNISISIDELSLPLGIHRIQIQVFDGLGMNSTFNTTIVVTCDMPLIVVSNYQPFVEELTVGNLTIQIFDSTVSMPNSLEIDINGTEFITKNDWENGEVINISYSLFNDENGLYNITITAYDGISYTTTRNILVLSQMDNGSIYAINVAPYLIGQSIIDIPAGSNSDLSYMIIDYTYNSTGTVYRIFKDCNENFENGNVYQEGIWNNFDIVNISTNDFALSSDIHYLRFQVFDGFGLNSTYNITLIVSNDIPIIEISNIPSYLTEDMNGNFSIRIIDSSFSPDSNFEIKSNGTSIGTILEWEDGEIINISYSLFNQINGLHNISIIVNDGYSGVSIRDIYLQTVNLPKTPNILNISQTIIGNVYNLAWESSDYADGYIINVNGEFMEVGDINQTDLIFPAQNKCYEISIIGRNTIGVSNPSQSLRLTVISAPPRAPIILNQSSILFEENEFLITWEVDEFTDAVIVSVNGEFYDGFNRDISNMTFNVGCISEIYSFELVAVNDFGESGGSVIEIRDIFFAPPTPILLNESMTVKGTQNVRLEWEGETDEYLILVNDKIITNTNGNSIELTLEEGHEYEIKIVGINCAGHSYSSNSIIVDVLPSEQDGFSEGTIDITKYIITILGIMTIIAGSVKIINKKKESIEPKLID